MSDSIQTQGKTVNEAVSEALLQLGLRRDEVEIKVIEEPKSGLLGFIGGRPAKVMVRKKPQRRRGGGRDNRSRDDGGHSLSGGRGGRGGRGRGGRGRGGQRNNEAEARQDNNQGNRNPQSNRGGQDTRSAQDDNKRQEAGKQDSRSRRGGRGRGGRRDQNQARDNQSANQTQDNQTQDNQRQDNQRQSNNNQPRDNARRDSSNDARNAGRSESRNDNRNDNRGRGRSRRAQTDNRQESVRNEQPVEARNEEQRGGESRSRRSNRGGQGRGRGRDNQQQGVRRDELAAGNRPDNAQETEVRREMPAAEVVRETPKTREKTEMTQDHNSLQPADTPKTENAAPAAEAVATPTPVVKPKAKRKGWGGGLGSRLASKSKPEPVAGEQPEVVAEVAAPAPAPAPAASRPSAAMPRREERHDDNRGRQDYRDRNAMDDVEEVIISNVVATKYAQPIAGVTEENMDDSLQKLTSGMLARAGFPCDVEVGEGEYRQVRIASDDEDAGLLIGRHGQSVDAVEHLVERMASNAIDDRVRMNLDINEYRKRRADTLSERVADAIAQVREDGRPYHVESMSARERRLVHLEAEPVDGIRTYTMIGGGGKHVVIALDEENDDRGHNED